jgi:putative transposase
MKELTELRAELPWLADVPRNVCSEVLAALDIAWQRYFKRVSERPKFKKKGISIARFTQNNAAKFHISGGSLDGSLTFQKIGALRTVVHRSIEGTQKRATISCDAGMWFVSILTEREVDDPVPMTGPAVAIDRGVVNLIADSNRRIVENPRFGERAAKQLARAQRALKRKEKGSKNQQKARLKVARIHRRVARQREHLLHVESKRYASENHAAIIVEDLAIGNMTASAKGTRDSHGANVRQKAGLNRAILDGGWSRFVELATYKTAERGGRIVKVPAAYSSQTCAACGVVDTDSRQSQAKFACTACGHEDNADINAAKVLLALGLAAAYQQPTKAKSTLRTARRKTI